MQTNIFRKALSLLVLPSLLTGNILGSTLTLAWGQKGHDTTCAIAQNHLTQKALDEVTSLLDGKSMVYWANWLDNASNTPEYAYSKTWHYKNIDLGETFESAPLEPKGDIVRALGEQIAKLKDESLSREEHQLALKMVIHLMGDVHQPMHMGRKLDLGGNKYIITYFNNQTNLHSTWDSQLVESAHKWSHTEWVEEIDRLSKEEVEAISKGDVKSWAKETYQLATKVYEGSPTDKKLSYDYIAKWTPVIEQQFLRGGIRLASILNEIYK